MLWKSSSTSAPSSLLDHWVIKLLRIDLYAATEGDLSLVTDDEKFYSTGKKHVETLKSDSIGSNCECTRRTAQETYRYKTMIQHPYCVFAAILGNAWPYITRGKIFNCFSPSIFDGHVL